MERNDTQLATTAKIIALNGAPFSQSVQLVLQSGSFDNYFDYCSRRLDCHDNALGADLVIGRIDVLDGAYGGILRPHAGSLHDAVEAHIQAETNMDIIEHQECKAPACAVTHTADISTYLKTSQPENSSCLQDRCDHLCKEN